MTFSRDGKFLAVQTAGEGAKYTTQIWDVAAGARRQTLAVSPKDSLSSLAFSWDGKRVAGIRMGRNLRRDLFLWDAATGKQVRKKEGLGPTDTTDSLAFSPDGKTLAVGGDLLHPSVHLLDAATLEEKAPLKPPADTDVRSIDRLAFSPDGKTLAAACGVATFLGPTGPGVRGVFLWDLSGTKKPRRLPARYDTRLVFAPDSKTLACRDEVSSEIHLWDVASGRALHQWPGADRMPERAASPDGQLLVATDADDAPRLWDAATGKPLRRLQGHRLALTSCLFSPDGKRVIGGGVTGFTHERVAFQVWDIAEGKPLRRFEVTKKDLGENKKRILELQIQAAGISADGKRLMAVVSGGNHTLPVQLLAWDLDSGTRLIQRPYKCRVFDNTGSIDAPVAFAPDGESVSVWLGERVGLEEVATGSVLATLPTGTRRPKAFSPDGRLLAAPFEQPNEKSGIGELKGIALIETASGEEVIRLELKEFEEVAFLPDGRGIVVTDGESLRVWDTDTGARLHQMTWPESIRNPWGEVTRDNVRPLAILPGGRIATGMREGNVLIWDLVAATWPVRKPKADLGRKDLEALWSDLAGNARTAHRALYTLAEAPAQTVPFLNDRLQPRAVDTKRIKKLLADLDGASFEEREAASRELGRIRYEADILLRRALEGKPSPEVRQRLQAILAGPKKPPADALRTLRAIAVLERIGTPEARRILEKLADGAAATETRAAQAALQRLNRR
jgi:WD40 repeat protein